MHKIKQPQLTQGSIFWQFVVCVDPGGYGQSARPAPPPPEQSQSKEVSKQYWSESPEILPSYLQYWAIIERHLNGVSPAGRWWSALSAIFILFPLINLTLNAPIATKVASLSRLLKCLEASMANSVEPDQTAPIGAVCSGSTLLLLYLIHQKS